jgi:hypothetical protein
MYLLEEPSKVAIETTDEEETKEPTETPDASVYEAYLKKTQRRRHRILWENPGVYSHFNSVLQRHVLYKHI